jgi:hypothetical protein
MQIEVTATSEDGSTSSQSFDIAVTDSNEFNVSAVSDGDAAANSVAENAEAGDSVGVTAFASDNDGSSNGVTYSLSENPNDALHDRCRDRRSHGRRSNRHRLRDCADNADRSHRDLGGRLHICPDLRHLGG